MTEYLSTADAAARLGITPAEGKGLAVLIHARDLAALKAALLKRIEMVL